MQQEEQRIPLSSDQRQFWNTWNTEAREKKGLDRESLERGEVAITLLRSLKLERPEILELGCGTGWLSLRLAQFGATTAVDIADDVIERAKAKSPHINFIAGDFLQIPFPRNHFDVVICLETLSHVADQRLFIEGIASVLKPSGFLILTTQNKTVMKFHDVTPVGIGQIRKWVDKKELQRLLLQHFRVLHLATIVPPNGHRGFLRIVNSAKVNAALGCLTSQASLNAFKIQMGFGKTLVALAQRRK